MFDINQCSVEQKNVVKEIVGILNGLRLQDAQIVLSVVHDELITNSYVRIIGSNQEEGSKCEK